MSITMYKNGYCYIPLPRREEIVKETVISHARFDNQRYSGKIVCLLTVQAPIHIGSGVFELGTDAGYRDYQGVVKGLIKENGIPIIPGSSLKGAIRSVAEAISYSCFLERRSGFNPCQVEKGTDRVCVACRIFGAMGYMGRISFTEAVPVSQTQNGWQPMDKPTYLKHKPDEPVKVIALWGPKRYPTLGRRFYPHINYLDDDFWKSDLKNQLDITAAKKDKRGHVTKRYNKEEFMREKVLEPYDFIPPKLNLQFQLKFENLEEKELGLLLSAMGISEQNSTSFFPSLGGSKPFCFGTFQVQIQEVSSSTVEQEQTDFENFDDTSEKTNDVSNWVSAKIRSFQNSNIYFSDGYAAVREVYQYPVNYGDVEVI